MCDGPGKEVLLLFPAVYQKLLICSEAQMLISSFKLYHHCMKIFHQSTSMLKMHTCIFIYCLKNRCLNVKAKFALRMLTKYSVPHIPMSRNQTDINKAWFYRMMPHINALDTKLVAIAISKL